MRGTFLRQLLWAIAGSLVTINATDAADWPMYRADAGRSASTDETLPDELTLDWVYHSPNVPQPAWPRSDRMTFDRAFQPIVADGVLLFGSSVDGKLYALNADTGIRRWVFATEGPIRFAPAAAKGRVYVASDDGSLYCLRIADGELLWRRRGGPDDGKILGNERMISRWPARGGPVLSGDVVYFGAGIWPSDGIYLYALDAQSGEIRWLNDSSGQLYMPQPHGGANARSGVSSQGYLAVGDDRLLVPTGRAVPAVFGLNDGELIYFHLQRYGHAGGSPIVVAGPTMINQGNAYDLASGHFLQRLAGGSVAAKENVVFHGHEHRITAYTWEEVEKPDRKGNPVKQLALKPQWHVDDVPAGTSLIACGASLFSSGNGRICRIDMETHEETWSTEVEGVVLGLLAADGRLFATTEDGQILCYATPRRAGPSHLWTQFNSSAFGDNEPYATAAEEILTQNGVVDGYCVDLGCGNGALAFELAKRTNLRIVAIDDDPNVVRDAREQLAFSGVYGTQVMVIRGDPDSTPLPEYCADLVISGQSVMAGGDIGDETRRLLRPYGGMACVGKPGAMRTFERGPLEGAGNWTHQYADAAGSCCSDDQLVQGALGMLWFRDLDFDMPQRHGRGPAPLFVDGRLIVEGMDGLCAVNAYNGRELWRYRIEGVLQPYDADHLMGAAGTHSNFCVSKSAVYVRTGDRCLKLDINSGQELARFKAPPAANGETGTWGFIAIEGNTLFGTLVDTSHIVKWRYQKGDMSRQFTESRRLFALNANRGEVLWTYDAKASIRHNTIVIGKDRVYLVDRPQAGGDRLSADDAAAKSAQAPGKLIALDAATGKIVWQDPETFGTMLAVSTAHDALLVSYQPTRFRLPSEVGGRLAVYRASDGELLWQREADYASRPLINDRTIYAQGGAWDLVSGEPREFPFKRSYGCGILAGGAHVMVYRSATLGYFDLLANEGNTDYGGLRPGCWINAIPAGGLVLVPDASAGCRCSYLNKSWVALKPLSSD